MALLPTIELRVSRLWQLMNKGCDVFMADYYLELTPSIFLIPTGLLNKKLSESDLVLILCHLQ